MAFLKATPTDMLPRYDFRGNATNLAYWIAVPASAVVAIALEARHQFAIRLSVVQRLTVLLCRQVVVSAHSVQFLTRSTWSSSVSGAKTDDDVLFRAQHSSRYDPLSYNDGLEANTSPAATDERPSDAPSLLLPKSLAWKRYLATTMVLVAIAQFAIFVDMNVAAMLTLTGAFASLLLLFALPAACSFKLNRGLRDSVDAASGGGWVLSRGLPIAGVVIGGLASVVCLVSYAVAGQ